MSNLFPATPPTPRAPRPRTPIFPETPPPQTPPRTPSSNNDDSQYSSDFNNEWDRFVNNRNVTTRRPQNQSTPLDDDYDIRSLHMSDLDEEDTNSQNSQQSQELNPDKNISKPWANKEMPPIPSYPKQIIDVDAEGFDPFLMDNQKISDYVDEDKKENVVILYNGKYYLTSRNTIEQQETEALVYECIEGDKKRYENIVGNLPLYNIKKIGINISSDNAVGVEPEYIYMNGIDDLLMSENNWQYYSIIPLPDKLLVSVISQNEALKVGTGYGSGVGALHCQAGQGGLAGIIVKAYPSNSTETTGGKKKRKTAKKRKTVKKRKSAKKRKTIKKRNLKTVKKINKKRNFRTKKRN